MAGSALFIGVDGGGTSCKARIADVAGTPLGQGSAGPANIATDDRQALDNIVKACSEALQQAARADISLSTCSAVLGLAGANVGDYAGKLERYLPFKNTIICSDGEIAMHGALGSDDGTVAIIGTGSIYYHAYQGNISSVAGWGSFLSDQAGGAWLGRKLLEQTLLAMDRIIPHSPLTREVSAEFNEQQANLVCGPVDTLNDKSRSNQSAMQQWSPELLGAYAMKITCAAENGDPVAIALMQSGANHIESAVQSLIGDNEQILPLCFLGSLGPHYHVWLPEHLQVRMRKPANDALHGALQMAIHTFAGN